MRVIAPIPKQFEDSNGVPYANGKVTVYLHNSTSLARIYKEAEGGMLAPNPTILDSHGAWNAFVNGDTAYDYVVQDEHDNVIFSYSNVKAYGGSGGGGGDSSVPLVRVKFQNGVWSKMSGDDGFIKPNRWGVDSLFLPESCWWSIGVGISVANNTPRDLIQHLLMKYEWNSYISMDVPPLTYEEVNLPAMTYEADFTRVNTNNRYTTSLYKKDGATEDWLSVALTAYHDTLPNDLEWALWMNIFKVRDA